ncbi:DNA repair protein RAD51 homolog 3-like [Anneissia japonica]|uniref:DNA repair protein RAD51 homolog 3-like n=1 Tax=Anneissia japonica TaxID=1529436 RepID=UPI001425896F|nr:DNA repair protein RAD51 homolog 3-like [Anneissia japonica]XP_033108500.1 DNA repair protein RAD51 homolog 3-like [Anneissia japonica]
MNIGSLPLPPLIKNRLYEAGFVIFDDLNGLKPSQLSREIDCSLEEAHEVLKTLENVTEARFSLKHGKTSSKTALEILQEESKLPSVITFCEEMDNMLGGGIPLGKTTEICGAPGVGKTQICIQLAVDVQIPEEFGGLEGEAMYIDTEGSFMVERASEIAKAVVEHCGNVAASQNNNVQLKSMEKFTEDGILAGIHYTRCQDYIELIAFINTLPKFLSNHPKVRLIVIDSVAFHFRHDIENLSLRTRLLNGLAQNLIKLAMENTVAVVLTNQMTTKFGREDGGSKLIPALGESWGHAATVRLILYWQGNQRLAMLYKSPSRQEMTVPYQVTNCGVRSIPSGAVQHGSVSTNISKSEEDEENPRKKRRLAQDTN